MYFQKLSRLWLLSLALFISTFAFAQSATQPSANLSSPFSLSTSIGYDLPSFNLPYQELTYQGGRYFDATANYHFSRHFGIGLTYANMRTAPNIRIPGFIYVGTTAKPVAALTQKINRQYAGIGPTYRAFLGGSKLSVEAFPSFGRSWLRGGDAYATADSLTQLVNTGYDSPAWAAKMDLSLRYDLSPRFSLGAKVYYLRHFQVHANDLLDLGPGGAMTISHGENIYDSSVNPYTMTSSAPMVVNIDPDKPVCQDLSSFGAALTLGFRFGGGAAGAKKVENPACTTCCPDDGHRLIVTVRDAPTQHMLGDAAVVVKDMSGQPVATGTTNAFGIVEFLDVPHGTYVIEGKLYDVATTSASVAEFEFGPGEIVRKELFYEDLRFILKGVVINKRGRTPEPNVVARLSSERTGSVMQDNTNGTGGFKFQLDGGTDYTVVGSKQNRLSDIERVSTVGLVRSTTLFVELELGVDDFDCTQGAVLDIKYNLGRHDLLPEARFELNRLVQYLKDHPTDRVELGSHTDSQGQNDFNQKLSDKRASAAVDYIIGKGISRDRILARGYGETRLLNRCGDGVNCSDEEHRVNRRTEARLLCK